MLGKTETRTLLSGHGKIRDEWDYEKAQGNAGAYVETRYDVTSILKVGFSLLGQFCENTFMMTMVCKNGLKTWMYCIYNNFWNRSL